VESIYRTWRSAASGSENLSCLETLHRQLEYQLITDPLDFRPGAAGGVIPVNLQRIPWFKAFAVDA
jgi:hypothetical protein